MTASSSRLVDEFSELIRIKGLTLAGDLQIAWAFGDLFWPPQGGVPLEVLMETEPAFMINGYSRYVALARLNEEIRFFAAPLLSYGDFVRQNVKGDAARIAAIDAESEVSEMGVFPSLEDAVTLVQEYLSGRPFADVTAKRMPPAFRRKSPVT